MITLNNGVKIPQIGYGTYQTAPSLTQQAVENALRELEKQYGRFIRLGRLWLAEEITFLIMKY